MALPNLISVRPERGPASGGDVVRLSGVGFAASVAVVFGDAPAEVIAVREEGGRSVADVRTPPHAEGYVDVVIRNLDVGGIHVPGEEAVRAAAYRFLRPRIVQESDLTRLVRTLLRELKRQVIQATSIAVSVDYDDTPADGLDVIAISTLPSLILSGPRIAEDRKLSTNVPHEDVVPGSEGPELVRRRPPFTVDLSFGITAASSSTVELLNLMAAVATFLNRNRWVEMPRDPADPGVGTVRWEMDPDGELRTRLDGAGDVRAFTWGLVIRGFDVDEGLPLDMGRAVHETELIAESVPPAGL
jgi:hypothetical protein